MSESKLSGSINQHYLDKVMDLAEVMEVQATEDIYDARGMKLLAKGARVSREMQEKLIVHKLRKPIESSLVVAGGVDSNTIVTTAGRLIETSLPLGRILKVSGGQGMSPLSILSTMRFGSAMSMMLTITERGGAQGLEHSVMVSLLSICMAKKLRLSDEEQQVAALAGLLHDVGELYVDPAFLAPGKRLEPQEWSHIVVHPRTGQMLINELDSCPPAVGRAVAEHHERFDGTGYPRHLANAAISAPGQAVSTAEMIAGVLNEDHPLERAELALKIIPGEHARELLSAVSGALHLVPAGGAEAFGAATVDAGETLGTLFGRIGSALEGGAKLLAAPGAKSPKTVELLEQALHRTRVIERAFIGTGLDFYLNQPAEPAETVDALLEFEKIVATREIQWRLRDIARDLALHSATADEKLLFAPLITLLDDDSVTALAVAPPARLKALAPASFAGNQQFAA